MICLLKVTRGLIITLYALIEQLTTKPEDSIIAHTKVKVLKLYQDLAELGEIHVLIGESWFSGPIKLCRVLLRLICFLKFCPSCNLLQIKTSVTALTGVHKSPLNISASSPLTLYLSLGSSGRIFRSDNAKP